MAFVQVVEAVAHVHGDMWIIFGDHLLDPSIRGSGDCTCCPMVVFTMVQKAYRLAGCLLLLWVGMLVGLPDPKPPCAHLVACLAACLLDTSYSPSR